MSLDPGGGVSASGAGMGVCLWVWEVFLPMGLGECVVEPP